jgi:MFS superfamily sulfate permease-like transporter
VAELGRVAGTATQFGDVERHPENRTDPDVVVLRVEAGLFFANADTVRAAIRARALAPGTLGVVVDAEAVAFVDVTAVRMLEELAGDLRRSGRHLVVAHDLGQVGDLLPADAHAELVVMPTIDDAIAAVRAAATALPGG